MYNYRNIPIKRLKKSEVEFDFQMFGCCKFTLLLDYVISVYRTHTNSAPGYYFHARHLGGLVIKFSASDLLLEKVFYFDGKKLSLGVLYYL